MCDIIYRLNIPQITTIIMNVWWNLNFELKISELYRLTTDPYLTGQCVNIMEYFLLFFSATLLRLCNQTQDPSLCWTRKYIVCISSVWITGDRITQYSVAQVRWFSSGCLLLTSESSLTRSSSQNISSFEIRFCEEPRIMCKKAQASWQGHRVDWNDSVRWLYVR